MMASATGCSWEGLSSSGKGLHPSLLNGCSSACFFIRAGFQSEAKQDPDPNTMSSFRDILPSYCQVLHQLRGECSLSSPVDYTTSGPSPKPHCFSRLQCFLQPSVNCLILFLGQLHLLAATACKVRPLKKIHLTTLGGCVFSEDRSAELCSCACQGFTDRPSGVGTEKPLQSSKPWDS